jgi:hypothetical protein
LARLGFDVAQAVIVQWTTATLDGLVVGTLSGGLVGSSRRDGGAALAGAFLGALAGMVAGSLVRKAVAAYQAQRTYPAAGNWQLTPTEVPASARLSWAFGNEAA